MPEIKPSKIRGSLRLLIAFVIAFDVAFIAQRVGGAYDSEFGGHPDEAAHYVTGLFVRDAISTGWHYAAGGFKGSPAVIGKEFADNFYGHYPKVALGVWPPAFYLTQSAWTLPFGASRTSTLLFMAMLAACTGTLLYRAVRIEFGEWAGATAGILWLCTPLVREQYGMIMAETLSALAMFAATLAWGRFLDEGKVKDAIVFALLAALAILTKGTGLALVLMCILSICVTRKWRIVGTRGPWIAALIVSLLAGPWTWYFRNYGKMVGGWADNSGGLSLAFTRDALPFYAREIILLCGASIATFAAIGAVARLRGESAGRWASQISFVLAALVFQALIPVGLEKRHIIPVAPSLVMLAIAGVHAVARLPAFRAEETGQVRRERLWLVLLLLLVLPLSLMGWERKGCAGFSPLATEVLTKAGPGARILVSSDASGEGMFISEIAMHDARPNLIIERASKSLVEEKGRTWDGRNLRCRFKNDDDLLAYLASGRFAYILLDDAVPEHKRVSYHDQIKRVIDDHSGIFQPVEESVITRDNEPTYRPARLYLVAAGRPPVLTPPKGL